MTMHFWNACSPEMLGWDGEARAPLANHGPSLSHGWQVKTGPQPTKKRSASTSIKRSRKFFHLEACSPGTGAGGHHRTTRLIGGQGWAETNRPVRSRFCKPV
jgi:hypothetical protein